jgi:hypothetical protein
MSNKKKLGLAARKELEAAPEKNEQNIQKEPFSYVRLECSELFCDQFDMPIAVVRNSSHLELHSIKSRRFRNFIGKLMYDKDGTIHAQEEINSIISLLEAEAAFGNKHRDLNNRVARNGNCLLYDLSNDKWQAIKITENGWSLIESPLVFKRYSHMQPQVMPDQTGDIELLRPFIPIKDENNWILLKVWLVVAFIAGIPHPCLCPFGPQGSAKSFTNRLLKKLIDPSTIEIFALPKERKDFIITLQHHWFLPFDNLRYINEDTSDTLCRAVSGTGINLRQLYTDEDDQIFKFKRVISLNGINIVPQLPDLLDRSILLEFERIPQDKRRPELELETEFELVRPKILGGIFDILSKALAIYPTIKLKEMPRMADFAIWGESVARVMGYGEGIFLQIYRANVEKQNTEAIAASSLGELIMKLMEEREEWSGTPSRLLSDLKDIASILNIDIKHTPFPKAPSTLGRRINELKINLFELGIFIDFEKSGNRIYTITKKQKAAQEMPPTPPMPPKKEDFTDGRTKIDSFVDSRQDGNKEPRPNAAREMSAKTALDSDNSQSGQQDGMGNKFPKQDEGICDWCKEFKALIATRIFRDGITGHLAEFRVCEKCNRIDHA